MGLSEHPEAFPPPFTKEDLFLLRNTVLVLINSLSRSFEREEYIADLIEGIFRKLFPSAKIEKMKLDTIYEEPVVHARFEKHNVIRDISVVVKSVYAIETDEVADFLGNKKKKYIPKWLEVSFSVRRKCRKPILKVISPIKTYKTPARGFIVTMLNSLDDENIMQTMINSLTKKGYDIDKLVKIRSWILGCMEFKGVFKEHKSRMIIPILPILIYRSKKAYGVDTDNTCNIHCKELLDLPEELHIHKESV